MTLGRHQERPEVQRVRSTLSFLFQAVIVGLAIAFLLVWWKPALLPAAPIATATSNTPYPNPLPGFADAVARAAPAVVNIYTARVVRESTRPAVIDQFLGESPSYRQRIERSLGSGVIVDPKVTIITNQHVIAGADSI